MPNAETATESLQPQDGSEAARASPGPLPEGFGLSFIVPVFNEREAIAGVIGSLKQAAAVLEAPSEIIIVDDGSTDGTEQLLEEIDGVRVIHHTSNRGYGAALKTGIRRSQHDWICITDADGTYPIDRVPELARMTCDADMVVGARTAKDAKTPWGRRPAKWVIRRLACYLARASIPDINSGLRIMKKEVLERFLPLLPDGFSFTSTITLAMITNAHTVVYVPISYAARGGRSKIRPIYDTLNFIQLIIRMALYFNPLRVFLPMSLILFLIGASMLAYRAFVGSAMGVTTTVTFVAAVQLLAIGLLADLIDKRVR